MYKFVNIIHNYLYFHSTPYFIMNYIQQIFLYNIYLNIKIKDLIRIS